MAARQLLCAKCGKRSPVGEEHGSHTAYVWGFTKLDKPNDDIRIIENGVEKKRIPVPQMLCDACCDPIHKGELACAWTFWRDPEVKHDWEDEYLERISDRKQHDW